MDVAQLVLDYLRVFLSGPVIAGAFGVTFLFLFRSEIGDLVNRIIRIRGPGGSEVVASQQAKKREEIVARADPPQLEHPVTLPKDITLTAEQREPVLQLIGSERANAALWEYRYLNVYLARGTQAVLDWLGKTDGPISLRFIDSHLQTFIPDARERDAINAALQKHHLINVAGDFVKITPKGREYLEWRGPLPPVAPIPNPSSGPPGAQIG
jgi:hypothetical protein